jgi:hypothetical protein
MGYKMRTDMMKPVYRLFPNDFVAGGIIMKLNVLSKRCCFNNTSFKTIKLIHFCRSRVIGLDMTENRILPYVI